MLKKNVASQKVRVFAFDSTTNLPKTGDAANITAYLSKDYGAVTQLTDTSATEESSSNAEGMYWFDISQSETNADDISITAKSSTSNIVVVGAPARIRTTPQYSGDLVIDSSGRVDVSKISGTSQTARDIGASVLISSGTGTGQLNVTSGVAAVNVTQFGGSNGTFSSGRPEVNTTHIAGTAWASTTLFTLASHDPGATIGTSTLTQTQVTGGAYAINSASFAFNSALDFTTTQKAATLARVTLTDTVTTYTGNTPQTGDSFARIGATGSGLTSLAPSATALSTTQWTNTRAGYLDNLSGGAVALASGVNVTQISGDSTAADNAESFFDGTGYAGTNNVIPTVTTLTNAPPDSAGVTTLLSRIPAALFSGITSLAQWIGLLAGKQTGNSTARTELRATGAGSGTYDETTDSQEAIRDRGDSTWVTAPGFSTHAAADVWAVGTRLLSAGTNIVLAKGTGVTGFNDLDAVGIRTAVGLASANLDTQFDDVPQIKAVTDSLVMTAGKLWVLNEDGDPLASAADLATVDTVVDAVKVTTDKLDDTVEDDGGTYRFTTNALEQAPTGGSAPTVQEIVDGVLDEALADHLTNGTVGNAIATTLVSTSEIGTNGDGLTDIPWNSDWDAEVQSGAQAALTATGVTSIRMGYIDNVNNANLPGVPAFPDNFVSLGINASGHLSRVTLTDTATTLTNAPSDSSGTTTLLSRIGGSITISGGRVASNVERWNGSTPGNLDGNGFVPSNAAAVNGNTTRAATLSTWLDNNRLDVAVSSRPDAAGIRTAVGLASADLDTQLSAIDTAVDSILDDTGSSGVVVATNNDKTGYGLAADAVNSTSVAASAVTEIQSGLSTSSSVSSLAADVTAVLTDTNELQTDWANGGRLDTILDARASQTSVDALPNAAAIVAALRSWAVFSGYTWETLQKELGAALAGNVTGDGTLYRSPVTNAVVLTVAADEDGNRTVTRS